MEGLGVKVQSEARGRRRRMMVNMAQVLFALLIRSTGLLLSITGVTGCFYGQNLAAPPLSVPALPALDLRG